MSIDTPDYDYFRYIPLGGLDEVGMNCALVECNGSMLMIDCGYTFPDVEDFGVDYILPDWSYAIENVDRLDGVVITHGHQDHIGALPYFLKEVDVPVYSGRLTLAMIESQLAEQDLAEQVTLSGVETDELLEIGPFTIEFIHVNHSVPNARAVSLNTPLGRFVITGDWKLDLTPRYEPVMDMQTLSQMGRDGVAGLFGDSTNAEVDGTSTSEQEVHDNIQHVLSNAPGRVIVAQFSSNLHRLRSLLDLAYRHNRKVLLLGRSLRDNFDLALEHGYIEVPGQDMIIRPHEVGKIPDKQLMVISTGSQAEPRASLTRMGHGDHHHISISDSDIIILSARSIPGNERGIQTMIDNLTRRGADVIRSSDATIHGSGHAMAEELKLMLNLTKPDYLVPVHGRYRMRKKHAELGEEVGVPEQLLIENGDVLEFTKEGAKVVGQVKSGRVIVDGKNVGDLEDIELRDRAKLAHSGIIVAFVVVDRKTGDLAGDPELIQQGFIGEDEERLIPAAAQSLKDALGELSADARRDISEVKEATRLAVRRYFRKRIDRKPVVIPIIHEL